MWHHQRLVILEKCSESVALRARTAGIVEREKLRSWRRGDSAIVRALEPFRKAQGAHCRTVDRRKNLIGERNHTIALTLGERCSNGIAQASRTFGGDRQAVYDHQQLLRAGDVTSGPRDLIEVHHTSVDCDTKEALRPEVLHHDIVSDFIRESERKRDVEAGAARQREYGVRHRLYSVRFYLPAAIRTERVSHSRPEQAKIVVDLGRSADGRPGSLGGILLLDRDGRRETFNGVDVWLFHPLEELPRI